MLGPHAVSHLHLAHSRHVRNEDVTPGTRRASLSAILGLVFVLVQSAPLFAEQTYTISGRIVCGLFGFGIPGIELNGLPGDPETDSDGYYHATVPAGWSGAAYPQQSLLHFDPPFRVYNNVNANLTSNYKTALPETIISGHVRTAGGQGIGGVTMNGLHGTPVTNYHGFYLSYEGSSYTGTITPQKTGYTFTPASRNYQSRSSDVDDADFTGTQQGSTPGITVSPTSGLQTTEAGGTAQFTIVLDSQPTANVTIGLSSSDTTEGTVAPSSLTFTSANWSTPQTVTVTGVDDPDSDGNVAYTIVTAAATSTDANYNGLNAADVAVSNLDNDIPGITVTPTSGLTTTEAGGTAQFTVVLDAQPAANVTIGLSSSDTTEGTVSPSSLTFTAANWSTPQTVTVTGVDDPQSDGNVAYTILTAPATSADPNYSGRNAADVAATNTDDDVAEILVGPTSGLQTTEAGGTAQFGMMLRTQPTGNVTVGLSSSDPTEGTVAPSSVTFTPADWNVTQTVTVTGIDDPEADGDVAYTIITAPATSTDASYSGRNAADVAVTNVNDDFLLVTPSGAVDFATVTVGETKELDAFTVTNTGSGTLTGGASVSDPFSVVSGGTFDLAAGASQVVRIRFSPTAETSYNEPVSFVSNMGSVNRSVTGQGEYYTLVVDNRDNAADRRFGVVSGSWSTSTWQTNRWAADYHYTNAGNGSAVAAWYFTLPEGGIYEVSAWWPDGHSAWGSNVPYRTYHRTGNSVVRRDQRSNGGQWNALGTCEFVAGTEYRVEIANDSPSTYVLADAIRVKWVREAVPVLSVAPAGDVDFGQVLIAAQKELDAYTATNTGEGTLSGTVRVPSPFSVVSGGTLDLGPGASQVVRIRFAPAAEADYSEDVSFASNGGTQARTVTGSGVASLPSQLVVEPAGEVDFGQLPVGTSSE
ncbi:MAG TPA: Calx-beta domain-containing protein, partial [Planctomycetota bacterium]|nr:Calx-beta domain-containing protein [Planctomycetota bacterium]